MRTALVHVRKSALWALLLGGSTGFIGIWLSMGFAHSGSVGRAIFLLLTWPIELTEALDTKYLGGNIAKSVSPDMLWLIPQILIYFFVILLVRTVWFTIKQRST